MIHDYHLFGRTWALALTSRPGAAAAQYSNVGDSPSSLRITFDIAKSPESSANKATFTVYNLSSETRGALGKGTLVTFSAGYGDHTSNLFLGEVQKASTDRNGADLVTKLECADGEGALTHTILDRNFPPDTTAAQIFKACAEAMSVATAANPSGLNAGIALGIPRVTYPRGFKAMGAARDTMDYLCKTLGLKWSIQNGAIDIIPRGAHAGTEAVILNAQAGLIGVPSLNESTLTFSSLINPAIAPNRLIKLESVDTRINGFYKATSCKYGGDTHQSKWQVDCEGEALPNAQQQRLTAASGFNYAGAQVTVGG